MQIAIKKKLDKRGKMVNFIRGIIACYMCLSCFTTVSVHADTRDLDNYDVCNKAYRADYTQINNCLDNLLDNPYASPDYIFYQIEQMSMCVRAFTGKHIYLKAGLQQYEQVIMHATGKKFESKWIKSLAKYMDKRDGVMQHHNYCAKEVEDEEDGFNFEDVANVGCFAVSVNYYEQGELYDRIGCSQQIAPWTIDDVPPKVTFSVGSYIAGYVLCAIGGAEVVVVGGILKGLGICMGVEHCATSCQRQHDERHSKKDPDQPVDIRQFRNGH